MTDKARLAGFPVTFGTSGARGLVTDLTDAYCRTFTQAFLSVLEPGQTQLLVGRDLRSSSPGIAAACMAAAEAAGVACIDAGAVPTPALALAAQDLGLPALMVTGSHIPADRNGIKAYRPQGEITKADEQSMLAAEVEAAPSSWPNRATAPDSTILRRYIDRYTSAFAPDALAGLRVGVYEHSTVARDVLHEVLQALGAASVALGRSAEFVPVDTEAIRPEDRSLAKGWAASMTLDAIVSADGDADRPLIADETGTWLRGDMLGILCASELGANTVVTPVSSTTALEACGRFNHIIRTRIGSPHVIAAMAGTGVQHPVVGYEANGGFLLGSEVQLERGLLAPLVTRDALLPILLVLSMARRQGMRLSQLVASLPARVTHSDRLQHVAPDAVRKLLPQLDGDADLLCRMLAPGSGGIAGINRMDGLRVSFANGDIVHLRASGNAPELRCYAEAASAARAEALCLGCLGRIAELLIPRA